jgi:hypothetical protein
MSGASNAWRTPAMTMRETREQGFQHAWAESEVLDLHSSDAVDTLCGRLWSERSAAYCRGYLWFYLWKSTIPVEQADFVLNIVFQQHWDCDWFPRPWLEELTPIVTARLILAEQRAPIHLD